MANNTRAVAVITGASSGIGLATAIRFAEEGYDVVLAARRQKELDEAALQCKEYGADALAIATDTTSDTAVHDLAKAAIKKYGRIDVWVNNAGVYLTGKFEDAPLEDMRRVMDTNFFGYVHGAHAALTQFRKQGYGTLIDVSSVNAIAQQPYIGIYSASKAAIRALDESLRMELRLEELQDDIHICTVMPAAIDTNLYQNAANYTGRHVRALEPVYDPEYVAKHIVGLCEHPRREVILGSAGKLMALQRSHMPKRYEKQFSKYTEKDLLADEPATMTDGNLFNPLADHRGMHGGWRDRRLRADKLNAAVGAGIATAAGLVALGFVLSKRMRHT